MHRGILTIFCLRAPSLVRMQQKEKKRKRISSYLILYKKKVIYCFHAAAVLPNDRLMEQEAIKDASRGYVLWSKRVSNARLKAKQAKQAIQEGIKWKWWQKQITGSCWRLCILMWIGSVSWEIFYSCRRSWHKISFHPHSEILKELQCRGQSYLPSQACDICLIFGLTPLFVFRCVNYKLNTFILHSFYCIYLVDS